METMNGNGEQGQHLENIKQLEFEGVMNSVLFRFRQERETVSTFKFEGRESPIGSAAGGVKALGQFSSLMAHDVYKEVVSQQ